MQMQMTIRKNYRTIDWTEDLTLMTYQKEYFDYKGTRPHFNFNGNVFPPGTFYFHMDFFLQS